MIFLGEMERAAVGAVADSRTGEYVITDQQLHGLEPHALRHLEAALRDAARQNRCSVAIMYDIEKNATVIRWRPEEPSLS